MSSDNVTHFAAAHDHRKDLSSSPLSARELSVMDFCNETNRKSQATKESNTFEKRAKINHSDEMELESASNDVGTPLHLSSTLNGIVS